MELTVGQTFGDYEILGILGAGGMGKVYQVRNKISNRVEAMKLLLAGQELQSELVDRFTREIRIFGSLEHPNIAELRTALRVENQLAMIMEFVEGSSLDALMKQGRVPREKYIDYMCQALSALSYAHGKGVVHRDIKPANMMVTPAGVLKLMDFGIAKAATDPQLTKTGFMVGSVYYVSPEQIQGKDLDGRSDIYSLGVTLYELATGKRPFDGGTDYQIISAHVKEIPQPPRSLDPSIPAELSDIIVLALAKEPADRFQTADAMKNALASLIEKPVIAVAPQPARVAAAPSTKKSNRLLYMLAGSAATIAVIVGAIVELPKLMHTSAAGASQVAHPVPTPDPVSQPQQSAPAAPAPAASSAPAAEPTPAQSPTSIAPAAVVPTVVPAAAPAKTQVMVPAKPSPGATPAPQTQVSPAPIAQPEPPASPQPAVHPAAAPNSAAVEELRERANLMSVRVGTVRTSFQSLQKQQAASGLSPRSDMVAAEQRLGYQLDQAEASLQQGDAAGAKKRLDAAERDLEKLESFLGK